MKRMLGLAVMCGVLAWSQGVHAAGDGGEGATLVTLHMKDAPAGEALAALQKQMGLAGAAMPADVAGWPKVSLDVEKEPYWKVLAALDDQWQKQIMLQGDGTVDTRLARNRPFVGARQVSGRFLLVLKSVEFGVTSPGPKQSLTGRAEMDMRAEPGMEILQITTTASLTAAEDEKGQSLVAKVARTGSRQKPVGDDPYGFPSQIVMWLEQPANPGKRIAKLEGTASAWMMGKKGTLTVDDAMKASTHPWAGAAVRINPLRTTADRTYQTEVSVDTTPVAGGGVTGDPNARADLRTLFNGASAQIFDGAGAALYNVTAAPDTNGRIFIKGTQVDPAGKADRGAPVKLVITMPTEVKEIKVPFAFKDLPMP